MSSIWGLLITGVLSAIAGHLHGKITADLASAKNAIDRATTIPAVTDAKIASTVGIDPNSLIGAFRPTLEAMAEAAVSKALSKLLPPTVSSSLFSQPSQQQTPGSGLS